MKSEFCCFKLNIIKNNSEGKIMVTKKIYLRGMTKHKLLELNKKFENRVKLKKLIKSHKNRDYFTY
jgi:hypothetical protein